MYWYDIIFNELIFLNVFFIFNININRYNQHKQVIVIFIILKLSILFKIHIQL